MRGKWCCHERTIVADIVDHPAGADPIVLFEQVATADDAATSVGGGVFSLFVCEFCVDRRLHLVCGRADRDYIWENLNYGIQPFKREERDHLRRIG
jgi:hypothetical protein